MTKRKILRWASILAVAAVALVLGACNVSIWFAPETQGLGGYVLDARTANGVINGATVTITDETGSQVYTTSTDSSGHWFWSKPSSGTYTATVSGTGYFFTDPVTVKYDDSTTGEVDAAPVAGVNLASLNSTSLGSGFSLVLMWNGTQQELDLHLTAPDGNYADTTVGTGNPTVNMDTPNWLPTANSQLAIDWNNGFGPNGAVNTGTGSLSRTGRVELSPTNPTSDPSIGTQLTTGTGTVIAGIDRTGTKGYGPTTITVFNIPNVSAGYGVTPNSYNKLNSADTMFEGVAEVYVDAPGSATLSTGGTSATTTNAVLYLVTQNGLGGKYVIPTNTNLKTVSVARINIMDQEFQILPDIALNADGIFKSLAASSGIVSVPRSSLPN